MLGGTCVAAPCKINLHLRIHDRRPDGYHNLLGVFQTLDLSDEIVIESLKERSACAVEMDGLVPPERNIVYKAFHAFRRATGFDGGVRIRVKKRVPLGAGLGGGSSDAASVLLALNELAGTACSRELLTAIAASLGSDVPFFLDGGTALVSGRGERVKNINPALDYGVVLVFPSFPSDTAEAYRLLDLSRSGITIQAPLDPPVDELIRSLSLSPALWPFYNDFFPVLDEALAARYGDGKEGPYRICLRALRAFGAEFVALSGSGSTCFGVFSDLKAAKKAAKETFFPGSRSHFALPLARASFRVLQ